MTTTVQIGPETILETLGRDDVGENPIWDDDSGTWWWIDIPSGSIRRYHPASSRVTSGRLTEKIGCLGLDDAGGFVAGCETGVFAGRVGDDGAITAVKVADVSHPHPGMRFNDGIVDRQGRLRLSTMVMDISLGIEAGRWYLYDAAGGLRPTDVAGFIIPNGAAFSPDGRVFYASDTHRDRRTVFAFDHDPDDGALTNRRLFATIPNGGGRPDGATIDTDGCYWTCCLDAGRIHRFTPDGRLDRVLQMPMAKPTNCAFGGEDRATLFVTSLCRGASDLDVDPHAGRIALVRPGYQGLPEPRFAR